MGWLWFGKKKVKRIPRRWYIPKDNRVEFYRLLDEKNSGGKLSAYKFWSAVFVWCNIPEDKNHLVSYDWYNICNPYIEEVIED
jgi:hypothetical protein